MQRAPLTASVAGAVVVRRGDSPGTPAPSIRTRLRSPVPGFRFSGIATIDGGIPVAGAVVAVTLSDGGGLRRVDHVRTTVTDRQGRYEAVFDPVSGWKNAWVAASLAGHERYWRATVVDRCSRERPPHDGEIRQNLRLHRIQPIAAVGAFSLRLSPDDSHCDYRDRLMTCRPLRLESPATGMLNVRVTKESGGGSTISLIPPLGSQVPECDTMFSIPVQAGQMLFFALVIAPYETCEYSATLHTTLSAD